MEKPDSKGFINVKWPSKSIPHGGIFHTRVGENSTARQEFLKLLLDESKLTIAQRQKSVYRLRQDEPKKSPIVRENVRTLRPRTSCRRSLSAIRASCALDTDNYKPLKRGEDREKLKEKLADFMAFGDRGQRPPQPTRPTKLPPKLPTNKEKWNDLVTQIRERANWLAEMEVLGEADAHREVIDDQIAERMRALDALGVESECSTARSGGSGFSVLDTGRRSVQSNASEVKTGASISSTSSSSRKFQGRRSVNKQHENVEAYKHISPLQYTPRRRV